MGNIENGGVYSDFSSINFNWNCVTGTSTTTDTGTNASYGLRIRPKIDIYLRKITVGVSVKGTRWISEGNTSFSSGTKIYSYVAPESYTALTIPPTKLEAGKVYAIGVRYMDLSASVKIPRLTSSSRPTNAFFDIVGGNLGGSTSSTYIYLITQLSCYPVMASPAILVGNTPVKRVQVGNKVIRPYPVNNDTLAYIPLNDKELGRDISGKVTTTGTGTFGTYQGVNCLNCAYSNNIRFNLNTSSSDFTVSLRCYVTKSSISDMRLTGINSSNGSYLLIHGGKLQLNNSSGQLITGGTSVGVGWHHVCYTYIGGNATLYLDGSRQGSYNSTFGLGGYGYVGYLDGTRTNRDGLIADYSLTKRGWSRPEVYFYYRKTKRIYK